MYLPALCCWPAVVSRRLSFSSYPGELFSDDDLYITDSGLVVTETTNHNFNATLLEVSPLLRAGWQEDLTASFIPASACASSPLWRRPAAPLVAECLRGCQQRRKTATAPRRARSH